eukprot:6389930-Amphidinium_carterae.2
MMTTSSGLLTQPKKSSSLRQASVSHCTSNANHKARHRTPKRGLLTQKTKFKSPKELCNNEVTAARAQVTALGLKL